MQLAASYALVRAAWLASICWLSRLVRKMAEEMVDSWAAAHGGIGVKTSRMCHDISSIVIYSMQLN